MKAENSSERRKRVIGFAGFYAASFVLVYFILNAFGIHLTRARQNAVAVDNNEQSQGISVTERQLLASDSILHLKLSRLQKLDEQLAMAQADTVSEWQRLKMTKEVRQAELDLRKAIDSFDTHAIYTGTSKDVVYSTIVSSFRSMMDSRSAKGQPSFTGITAGAPQSGSSLQQLKLELLQKDNQIASMEEQIKTMQGKSFALPRPKSTDAEAQLGEIQLLKTAFNDLQKEYQAAQEKYNRVKTDNSNLSAQVSDLKKAATAAEETAGNISLNNNNTLQTKINSLEQKVLDLNADLYFTRVDCNLARADAQQIISNARQRKELLTESLAMLSTLAKYKDATVQKKAKEKVVLLNHIATALHD